MKNELTAKRIQLALSNSNMRPQELADKADIGKASISQYVNGSHAPGNRSAEKIGKILKVNPLWLMGFDVPMEPNTYEDQRIMIFNAELEDALNILQSQGYSWNYTQSPDCDIVIKNKIGKIIACILDNELVSRYESLKEKDTLTPELLLHPFILYPEEQDHISKYRDLDSHGKEMVDFTLLKEWERSTAETPKADSIVPMSAREDTTYVNAAHALDGATQEDIQHDEDIMDAEDF